MSVVMMCNKDEPGAERSEYWSKVANSDIFLKTDFEGRVLSLRERNGYNDSDFYATVWMTNAAVEIEYATTRGWSYPNNATVDATDEVRAKYEIWKAEAFRKATIRKRWELRADRRAICAKCKITEKQYYRLASAILVQEKRERMFKLLSAKLRSPFRIKMEKQVREWLTDPSPKYPWPLSFKQLEYV